MYRNGKMHGKSRLIRCNFYDIWHFINKTHQLIIIYFSNTTLLNDFVERSKILQGYKFEKNDFAERSKILLDTDLKIILLDY